MTRAERLMAEAEKRLNAALKAYEKEAGLDEAFGAPTAAERGALETERQELAELERRVLAEPRPVARRQNLMWSWNKRRR